MTWIKVEERLPDYNVPVLVVQMSHWDDKTNIPVVTLQRRTHTDATGEHWERAEFERVPTKPIGRIMAWAPLPEPPTMAKEDHYE